MPPTIHIRDELVLEADEPHILLRREGSIAVHLNEACCLLSSARWAR